MDALFRPSPGDLLVGSREDQRSTKTYISSERSAILLELIENRARAAIKRIQRLHWQEHHKLLRPEEVADRYIGARRLVELHRGLLEHFGSVDGFSIHALVKMHQAAHTHRATTESSVGDDDKE